MRRFTLNVLLLTVLSLVIIGPTLAPAQDEPQAAAPATTQPAGISYRLSDDADTWPADKREAIVAAMDEAVATYNELTDLHKQIRVSYSPGTPTADANINGHIRFGGQIGSRTALHEIAHTLGVGTTNVWRTLLNDGVWQGPHANALIKQFDGPDAVLKGDRMHFWPYGLNYDREDGTLQRIRHVRMVAALVQDMSEARAARESNQ